METFLNIESYWEKQNISLFDEVTSKTHGEIFQPESRKVSFGYIKHTSKKKQELDIANGS